MRFGEYGFQNCSPSIDRVDASKGYIKGNVAIICYRCNLLKTDSTPEELSKVIEFLKKDAHPLYDGEITPQLSSWVKIKTWGSMSKARKKHLEFNITREDILKALPEKLVCPVLGYLLDFNAPCNTHNQPSVDRKDSTKGYVKGNIQIISFRANRIKYNASIEELTNVLNYMKSFTSTCSFES